LDIYDTDLIFSCEGASKTADNNGLKINQILEYLRFWKQNIPLKDYAKRREKHTDKVQLLEVKLAESPQTRTDALTQSIINGINEIETLELKAIIT
jgi:hypothetical protein